MLWCSTSQINLFKGMKMWPDLLWIKSDLSCLCKPKIGPVLGVRGVMVDCFVLLYHSKASYDYHDPNPPSCHTQFAIKVFSRFTQRANLKYEFYVLTNGTASAAKLSN